MQLFRIDRVFEPTHHSTTVEQPTNQDGTVLHDVLDNIEQTGHGIPKTSAYAFHLDNITLGTAGHGSSQVSTSFVREGGLCQYNSSSLVQARHYSIVICPNVARLSCTAAYGTRGQKCLVIEGKVCLGTKNIILQQKEHGKMAQSCTH
jgi:hypothetical protein